MIKSCGQGYSHDTIPITDLLKHINTSNPVHKVATFTWIHQPYEITSQESPIPDYRSNKKDYENKTPGAWISLEVQAPGKASFQKRKK